MRERDIGTYKWTSDTNKSISDTNKWISDTNKSISDTNKSSSDTNKSTSDTNKWTSDTHIQFVTIIYSFFRIIYTIRNVLIKKEAVRYRDSLFALLFFTGNYSIVPVPLLKSSVTTFPAGTFALVWSPPLPR